jgi:hypothetical protein
VRRAVQKKASANRAVSIPFIPAKGARRISCDGNRSHPLLPPVDRAERQAEFSSERIAAKCAIFDAKDTISAFCGNAIEKMKFFEANNHTVDPRREK